MAEKTNFLVMASWGEVLKGYDEAGSPEIASELAKQIMYYGVFGEITTEDPVIKSIVMGMCAVLIDKSKNKYNACKDNGARGGRPERYSKEDMLELREQQHMSNAEIAEAMDCDIRTVDRKIGKDVSSDDDI